MVDRRRSSHALAFVMLAAQGTPGVAWLLRPPLSRTARMTMAAERVASTKKVAIAGGGPAGSLMAIYLARDPSFEVDIFESSTLDAMAGASNRSYNVVMMERAFGALQEGGVDLVEEAGDEAAVILSGTIRMGKSGVRETEGFKGTVSMSRADAALVLLKKASAHPRVKVHTGTAFTGADLERRIAKFEDEEGGTIECQYDMLVGADGVNSRVRSELEENIPDFKVEQRLDFMAYKTFVVPVMRLQGAMTSWKTKFLVYNSKVGCLLAPPGPDGTMTVVCIQNAEGPKSFQALMKTTADVRHFFSKWYPGVFGDSGPGEDFAEDFLHKRPVRLKTTICSRLAHGHVVLIGDAAHSMWASLGQGMQAALEDCRVLGDLVAAATDAAAGNGNSIDIPAVLQTYSDRRLDDARAVCLLSEEGFGGERSSRPGYMAQLAAIQILHKTLGRVAPKMFPPPALFKITKSRTAYGEILRGKNREIKFLRRLAFCVAMVGLGTAVLGLRMLLGSRVW